MLLAPTVTVIPPKKILVLKDLGALISMAAIQTPTLWVIKRMCILGI